MTFKCSYLVIWLFIISQTVVKAQTQDTSTSKIYIGVNSGFSIKDIGYSQFLFNLGGNVLYNWDNNFVRLSYNRLFEFDIPFGVPLGNDRNANFNRFELLYGYTMIISKRHNLFKHFSFSASIGVSYNYIRSFKDEEAERMNRLSTNHCPGIPLGIAFTNNIGHDIYFGWEIKYHIISKFTPYGEYNAFLMVNVF